MAQKTEKQYTDVKSTTVDLKTEKYFRCRTCNSGIYPITKKGIYDDGVPAISFHSDCQIEFLNQEQYDKATKLEQNKRLPSEWLKIKKKQKKKNVTQKRHKTLHIQQFLKKARIICKIEGDFCKYDFMPEMSEEGFRKKVSRLKKDGLVFRTQGGRTPFYTVKGEKRWHTKSNVTLEGMGVGREFEKILRDAKIQYPQIHAIKIFFPCSALYYFFQKEKRKINKSNKIIKMDGYQLNDHVRANVQVYPNMVEVDLSCTSIPIVYDTKGALELIAILQQLRDALIYQTTLRAEDVPYCYDWIIKQYHFNKDSKKWYSGEKFEVKVSEMSAGFIRFYSKKFFDGSVRVRLEQEKNPNSTVADEAVKMVRADNYVFGRVGSKLSPAEAYEILYIQPERKPIDGFSDNHF